MGIIVYVDIKYSLRSALLHTHPIHWSIGKKYLFNLWSMFISRLLWDAAIFWHVFILLETWGYHHTTIERWTNVHRQHNNDIHSLQNCVAWNRVSILLDSVQQYNKLILYSDILFFKFWSVLNTIFYDRYAVPVVASIVFLLQTSVELKKRGRNSFSNCPDQDVEREMILTHFQRKDQPNKSHIKCESSFGNYSFSERWYSKFKYKFIYNTINLNRRLSD